VTVRPAVPEDAAAIARVHVRSWQAGYRGLLPDAVLDGLSVEARTETWRAHLGAESLTLVCEDGGAVVGFCALLVPGRDAGGAAEIAALYVEPERWRGGVGSELLDAARREALGPLVVWVMAGNDRALAFYERAGFARDGREKREPVAGLPAAESPAQIRLRRPG
jgi:ribosomal protein S18 acetylase RimI-like enzyme